MNELEIIFPGGKKVSALRHGFEIAPDQPRSGGGDASAPTPFDLFLASMGTCAGIFVLGFIQSRGLSSEGLKILESVDWDEASHRLKKLSFRIILPKDFPEKYKAAAIKAAEQCLVARTLQDPPELEITTDR